MHLIRENIASLYEQIASLLREEIQQGRFEPTGKLPSEAALCLRFGVSRVTVRLALARLEQEGTVARKQGKGTYAAGKQLRHGLDQLRSFHESLLQQGLQAEMRLLSREIVDAPGGALSVMGDEDGRCLRLQRLHLLDGAPLAVGRSYLPLLMNAADRERMERTPSYAILQELTGQAVARADLAIKVGQADAELAPALEVVEGAPLLVMERSSYFADGACCDRSQFYIRPERYEFVIKTSFAQAGG
ncbi:GntR family transcriptional regulator [Duganella sp. LjRoot269]|uniref:GntR family transcriptional regulator n=1 Tax=Duganella sp. LjRoot269 TaxID=3342305 RepID=UPI003ED149BC